VDAPQRPTEMELLVTTLQAEYVALTPASERIAGRGARVVPGGMSSHNAAFAPYALTIASAEGPWLTDVDERLYLDLWGNYTSLVHGHGFAPVMKAIGEQLDLGVAWSANSEAHIRLAELIVSRLPGADRVRFVSSGKEAGIVARELVRRCTGRPDILIAAGAYHGFDPGFGGPGVRTAAWGDALSFQAQIDGAVGAVFVELIDRHGGVRLAEPGFVRAVSEAARRAGALVVVDEVVSFRLQVGGLQTMLGVLPDLTMLGKSIGGGLPLGAVVGRADIMNALDPLGGDYHLTGSLHGSVLAAVAGRAALQHLTPECIATMGARMNTVLGAIDVATTSAHLSEVGSLGFVAFADSTAQQAFHLAALIEGVHMAPRGLIAVPSVLSHDQADEAGARLRRAMARVGEATPAAS